MNDKSSDFKNNVDQLTDQGETILEHAKHKFSDVYESSKDKFKDLEGCIEEYSEDFVDLVKEHPISSILIAGGIGFLIGHILKK